MARNFYVISLDACGDELDITFKTIEKVDDVGGAIEKEMSRVDAEFFKDHGVAWAMGAKPGEVLTFQGTTLFFICVDHTTPITTLSRVEKPTLQTSHESPKPWEPARKAFKKAPRRPSGTKARLDDEEE